MLHFFVILSGACGIIQTQSKKRGVLMKVLSLFDGMACGMCEAHVNEAIRNAFHVKKVTSSHAKKECVILSENNIDEEALKKVISDTGYTVLSVSAKPAEKHGGFLGLFRK